MFFWCRYKLKHDMGDHSSCKLNWCTFVESEFNKIQNPPKAPSRASSDVTHKPPPNKAQEKQLSSVFLVGYRFQANNKYRWLKTTISLFSLKITTTKTTTTKQQHDMEQYLRSDWRWEEPPVGAYPEEVEVVGDGNKTQPPIDFI